MRKIILSTFVLVFIAISALLATELSRSRQAAAEPRQPRSDAARTKRQLDGAGSPSIVNAYRTEAPAPLPAEPSGAPVTRTEEPVPSGRAGPDPGLTDEEVQANLDAAFTTETVDSSWSRRAESELRTFLSPVSGDHSVARSVECRNTMCRVEIEHDDEGEYRGFVTRMLGTNGPGSWQGGMSGRVVRTEPGGHVTSAIFFGKEGTTLPYGS